MKRIPRSILSAGHSMKSIHIIAEVKKPKKIATPPIDGTKSL